MSEARLPVHPTQRVDRSKSVTFTFEGRAISAYEGETIGAALCAAGITTLSRSFKYHRRRGLMCVSGRCPNCLMTVDGAPNIRTCIEPVHVGAVVQTQHAWPSVENDVQAIFDHFDRLLPVGFYYKTFMQPKWLWPTYEKVLRNLAGLGRLDTSLEYHDHTEMVHLHTTVAVVGGGPAGMSAALEAARLGLEVLLIDEQPKLGGHLQWRRLPSTGTDPDHQVAERLARQVAEERRIRHLESSTVFGFYEGRLLGVAQRESVLRVRADRVIVAAGCLEHPLVFQNNDLPGVYLGEGILRLVNLYGVRPGQRAVVIANDDRGLRVARELGTAGIDIAVVADARATNESSESRAVRNAVWKSSLGTRHSKRTAAAGLMASLLCSSMMQARRRRLRAQGPCGSRCPRRRLGTQQRAPGPERVRSPLPGGPGRLRPDRAARRHVLGRRGWRHPEPRSNPAAWHSERSPGRGVARRGQ